MRCLLQLPAARGARRPAGHGPATSLSQHATQHAIKAGLWAGTYSSKEATAQQPTMRQAPLTRSASSATPCRVWEGTYSSEEAMAQQLTMLRDYIVDPSDWVVAADVDEFHDWGGGHGRFIK